MSNRYKGAVISATPPTLVAGAGASGVWTLEQQMQANAAGLWPVNGPFYVEDVFSTYLYTGNSLTQTVTNNINLSGNGGIVWIKARNPSFNFNPILFDSTKSPSQYLFTNTTDANQTNIYQLTSFNANGFSLGDGNFTNNSAYNYVSWTFRKQPKFFDIVTWTGDGTNRAIPHNLGSVPGCMIVKCTNAAYGWMVYHRSTGATKFLYLNTTEAAITNSTAWNDTEPTSTVFTVGNAPLGNESGKTYVAYLFAHNAGGFGLTETENVISCGTFTTDGTGAATVNLGYEPQWVMFKDTVNADGWYMFDNMRGMSMTSSARTTANGTYGDSSDSPTLFFPSATGFTLNAGLTAGSAANIYIAIRRGPMKVPTSGTSVYNAVARTGTGSATTITGVGFPPDLAIPPARSGGSKRFYDRLRGALRPVYSDTTDSEATETNSLTGFDAMDGVKFGSGTGNVSSTTYINWYFRRAPSFFDEVCWTTTQTGFGITAITHNLGVVPELIITKARNTSGNWMVRVEGVTGNTSYLRLNSTDALTTFTLWGTPTTTTFSEDEFGALGSAGTTAVAYLFATCAGVSKVGSYTGNGTTQTINCGFTGGARFVLIKRTDAVGGWYVYDTTRGMTVLTDPYLFLNSTAAEVATLGSVTTVSTGFALDSAILAAINANGGTYIFLAIA